MLQDMLKRLINPVDRIDWAKGVIELDPYTSPSVTPLATLLRLANGGPHSAQLHRYVTTLECARS